MFGDYLDPLVDEGYRLLLVDMRGHGIGLGLRLRP